MLIKIIYICVLWHKDANFQFKTMILTIVINIFSTIIKPFVLEFYKTRRFILFLSYNYLQLVYTPRTLLHFK